MKRIEAVIILFIVLSLLGMVFNLFVYRGLKNAYKNAYKKRPTEERKALIYRKYPYYTKNWFLKLFLVGTNTAVPFWDVFLVRLNSIVFFVQIVMIIMHIVFYSFITLNIIISIYILMGGVYIIERIDRGGLNFLAKHREIKLTL